MSDVRAFFMPTVNLMGKGSVQLAGERIKNLGGKKALIVTDKDLVQLGVANHIKNIIESSGIGCAIFDGAEPNPTDLNVEAGLAALTQANADVIVSLGGGSPHDCAKGIALVATNGGSIRDYEGLDKSTKAIMPLIAINTTSGTASEMTRFCIITDTSRKVKMAIVDWRVTPTVSIDDPDLMLGMPPGLTAATGMDALTHAVEAYVSTIATPITDACAIKAIELIATNLRAAVANGSNYSAREAMTYAEFLAGMAFNNASLGYVHAMAHQLGGFYNLPHGVCNAILLPHVESFNLIASTERFRDIAIAMGENVNGLSTRDSADKAIEAIRKLSTDVGIPSGLSALGVKEEDLQIMAENAMKDACSFTNPRQARLNDIIQIFRNAL
ncbi:iron-containing alcohol dehydrogenase [Heliorestis acidaminivorans]|uniref:Iron-containing alcohol dehydrogenase n=1 Tax=Heliorestis acidaminivorans TaxID=553427 RepID=A0A6I0F3B4_9FIRM|nr:iron-containing alcohol dehydrogenase [Heliorestis acidaminivorans]KAB2954230.1 iron-containing alcohol dehydrogenase [Heliorestis acidaminivorans]